LTDQTDPSTGTSAFRSTWNVYRSFGPFLRPYAMSFAIAYGGLLGSVLVKLVEPWPLKLILDYVLLEKPMPDAAVRVTSVVGDDPHDLLTLLCIGMVLVVVVHGLFSYMSKYYMASAGQRVTNDVRRRVFDRLQGLQQAFHSSSRSGDLVVRLTSDINSLRKLLVSSVRNIASYLITFVSTIAVMLWMDWRLTLVALAIVPLLYLVTSKVSARSRTLAQTKRAKESEIASILQETMSSIATVQAFAQEGRERKRFAKESQKSLKASLARARMARGFGRVVQVLSAGGTALVVWYAARRALAGQVTPGDLVVFTAYVKDLYAPITKFVTLMVDFAAQLVSGERVRELLEAEQKVRDSADAIKAPRFRGQVSFERVTFGYQPGQPILQDLSFTVRAGQTVALVGSSGAGKSTIINLLLRFFDPWAGRIAIDGEDVRHFTLKSLRGRISVVLQDPVLFRRSIRENISYGKRRTSLEAVVAAATAAQAHGFIEELPEGYETQLDERGGGLSGGQRQRIALARAIIRDAPILVLDEPATGLDTVTELRLRQALASLMKGRTSFVVAHQLSTIQNADQILVIDQGRMAAQGTHADLMETSELYRRLFETEYRGGAEGAPAPGG
jgi:ABC-type multidrug transport system fused ATPase/permease subunit